MALPRTAVIPHTFFQFERLRPLISLAQQSHGRFPLWTPEQWSDRAARLTQDAQPAAVLMALVERADQDTPSLVLTRRPDTLRHHPGQVSFPGGRAEASDPDLIYTACREATEELGVPSHCIEPLTCLPKYQTVTGFQVQPVLALMAQHAQFSPDPREVARVFEVPLGFLMNPEHHEHRMLVHEGETIRFFAMPYEDEFIWGATAAMIRNLYHFFCALYEQSRDMHP
ncbi:MAG: CoA pyrophosphatase [Burkholderiaceae bacterium]